MACLDDAVFRSMPQTIMHLFVAILAHCAPQNPNALWERAKDGMADNYAYNTLSSTRVRTTPTIDHYALVLRDINISLRKLGKSLNDFPDLAPGIPHPEDSNTNREIEEQLNIQYTDSELNAYQLLNEEQRPIYDTIVQAVEQNIPSVTYIDGPGGTGKTFLYNCILAQVRSRGMIALAVASTALAASFFERGTTAHLRFKVPLNCGANDECNIPRGTDLAELMQQTRLIIFDEAPASSKHIPEAIDRMLRDVCETNIPFGGKVVSFGGDFRQCLPIERNTTARQILNLCLHKSATIWPNIRMFRLKANMRVFETDMYIIYKDAQGNVRRKRWSEYLLDVGDGELQIDGGSQIFIPDELQISTTNEGDSLTSLGDHVYPDIADHMGDGEYFAERAILTVRNDDVQSINDNILNKLPGEEYHCLSADSADEDEISGSYLPTKYLNTLMPSRMPPHDLRLKCGVPVMMLRNYAPTRDFYGTMHLQGKIARMFTYETFSR
jgi:hypothetical protein